MKAENDFEQSKLEETVENFESTDIYSADDISAGCLADPESLPEKARDAGGLEKNLSFSIGSRVKTFSFKHFYFHLAATRIPII